MTGRDITAADVRRIAGYTDREAAAVLDQCTKTTAAHRRWSRWWGAFAVSTFTAGAVLDTWAYNRHGYPATLTCWTRRTLGVEPRTRYGRLGQVALGSFLLWSLLHLVFGVLGPTRGRELA